MWGERYGWKRVVRVARNLSKRGVWHKVGVGREEQRPDVGLGPDVRALACPFIFTLKTQVLDAQARPEPSH
jgi:hypothetical protein